MRRGISFAFGFAICLLMLGHVVGGMAAKAGAAQQLATAEKAQTGETLVQSVRRGRGHYRRFGPRRHSWRGYRRHRGWYGHRRYRHYRRSPSFGLYFGPYYTYPRYGYYRSSRCSYWRYRCAVNWGSGTANYYGCLRYHGCW